MSSGPIPRVFMVLPYLGQVEDLSRRAAYLYPTRRFNVLHRPSQASLLAYGLNVKWAEMESGCSDDGAVSGVYDYLAILHADVSPDPYWLDTLVDELEDYGLDCIHAVTPIKSDEGLTSTAYGSANDCEYPIRKLSLREVNEELPPTFTIKDVRRKLGLDGFGPSYSIEKGIELALLPNTGCFVLKVAKDGEYLPWVREFPGFTIRDWFDRSGNRTRARVVSEDWGFGQWAASVGLRVGATRKVRVEHLGTGKWASDTPSKCCRDEGFFRMVRQLERSEAIEEVESYADEGAPV